MNISSCQKIPKIKKVKLHCNVGYLDFLICYFHSLKLIRMQETKKKCSAL